MYKINEEHLFEMANLWSASTRLKISSKGYEKHEARVKVQRNYSSREQMFDSFSVSIVSSPEIVAGDKGQIESKDLKKVFEFIVLNKDALISYYRKEFDTATFVTALKKI